MTISKVFFSHATKEDLAHGRLHRDAFSVGIFGGLEWKEAVSCLYLDISESETTSTTTHLKRLCALNTTKTLQYWNCGLEILSVSRD